MVLISADNLLQKDKGKFPSPTNLSRLLSADNIIVAIIIMAVTYNGVLAALLAHGFPVGSSFPAIIEVMLLLCSSMIILSYGIKKSDLPAMALSYVIFAVCIVISLKSDQLYVLPIRNFLIITIFTMLGGHCSPRTLKKVFTCSCVAVIITLTFEVVWLDRYVAFFEPARYLALTRGMSESEYSGGLSTGTILFEGRFSLGLYSGPRTSSIFLEQVSINCFAIIITIYLLTFGNRMNKLEIALYVGTVFSILATNNARMALIASIVFLLGYPVFPRLPKYLQIVFIPLIILSLFVTFSLIPTVNGDDLFGRMTTTYNLLTSMSADDLLFGSIIGTSRAFDSGYAFIIFSSTMFGLISYWIFISFVIPQVDACSKRCAWGLSIYVGIWLLVGGTGTFSMKTAPLLWLMIGFVQRHSLEQSKGSNAERVKSRAYFSVEDSTGFPRHLRPDSVLLPRRR